MCFANLLFFLKFLIYHYRFWAMSYRLISYSRADLGRMLLLNTNRKSYVAIPTTPLGLTLGYRKGQIQGHSDPQDWNLLKDTS